MTKCPVCNSERHKIIGNIKTENAAYDTNTNLVSCEDCSMYFVDPLPDEKKLSEIYAGTYHYDPNPVSEFLFKTWADMELQIDVNLIRKYQTSGTILDVGAGRGDLLLKFGDGNWNRWAFDPFLSEGDINKLKNKIGSNVNNFKSLEEYPENTFDAVVLRNIIEHTAETNTLLKNVNRILKSGGIIFIRTPNIESVDFEKLKTKWYIVEMAGHIVFFSPKTITKAFDQNNFTTEFAKPLYYSAPLSYTRSGGNGEGKLLRMAKSVGMAITPLLKMNGGDLQAIGRKK